jgi:hypothetical protein
MQRLALAGAIVLALASAAPVLAKPANACPDEASGHDRVTIDEWWDRSVAGWAEEGIAVYDATGDYTAEFDAWAQAFGLADGAAVEAFVRGPQWLTIDRNGNGFGCMKDLKNTNGTPGWIFVGIDDNAAG